ncbi:MAG: hypothetical protein L0L95_06275 [Staphylococcus equorum]|nr:hypothetical protein [Lactococcus lactis]MDN6290623.1 hypothetical protein [Tetragenococcus koreensis]MDN6735694.1 hypothetical protein [Tetragenococcus koreensis]MDN6749839.1 hypothetical protein [Staphylococcus equorum]
MKKLLIVSGFTFLSFFSFANANIVNAEEQFIDSIHAEETVIYDNSGEKVEPIRVSEENNDLITPLGAHYPTSTKWLNNGASYQSNEFSASGRRYGGYLFNSSTTRKFRVTFRKGGFGANLTSTAAYPGNIEESFNLPLSGSPYTLTTTRFFYFLVDNPNQGQTYHVRALN